MEIKSVPFFNYPWVYEQHEEEIKSVMQDVLKRGAFILQKELDEFEKSISKFIDIKHVFGVADGTNALNLALIATGIGRGSEVILPSHTYVASAAAIHYVGATPVPVECGVDHMLDANLIKKAITKRTRAIMPVQLNGRTCNMQEIQMIADEANLLIIEDAAQALGSKFKGRFAGTFGAAGTFSFFPAKVLGCFGDGGAVVTNDDAIGEKLGLLRDHGRNEKGNVVAWGTNSRLDNLQAAVLSVKLKYYVNDINRRRELANLYDSNLKDIEQLNLPPPPSNDGDYFDVYQNYELEADNRDELKSYLAEYGIGTLIQFGGKAIHQHKELGFEGISLPVTEQMYDRFLMLPMNTSLTDYDVEYVCERLHNFYKQ